MKIKKIAAISILFFTFSMLFGQEEERGGVNPLSKND
jgi:hypothetical protein